MSRVLAPETWCVRAQIDILSGHVRAGVSGKVTVNGQPFKAADFQKRSSYVHQRDVLMDTATVRSLPPVLF